MNALIISGAALLLIFAAICMTLAVATARDGIDFAKDNDAGAALVCFVTALFVGGIGAFLGYLAVKLIGG